jgi:hypothetical protein
MRIRALAAEHVVLRALCDRLEKIADDLPHLPSAEECHSVSRQLTVFVPQHYRSERAVLSALFPRGKMSPLGSPLLGRIHSQHAMDELHAQDLSAVLESPGSDAQMLGYMLRCFFDGCGRALAFEELTILTLARQQLSPSMVALLTACLGSGQG